MYVLSLSPVYVYINGHQRFEKLKDLYKNRSEDRKKRMRIVRNKHERKIEETEGQREKERARFHLANIVL